MAAVKKRKQAPLSQGAGDDEDPPLTPAPKQRALARHVKDMEDRTRYLLVSATLPGISLYYLVQEDSWSFDDPTTATVFKRRASIAQAIQALLRPGVFVVPCKVDDRGRLVLSSIDGRKVGKVRLAVKPSWKKKRAARR